MNTQEQNGLFMAELHEFKKWLEKKADFHNKRAIKFGETESQNRLALEREESHLITLLEVLKELKERGLNV